MRLVDLPASTCGAEFDSQRAHTSAMHRNTVVGRMVVGSGGFVEVLVEK